MSNKLIEMFESIDVLADMKCFVKERLDTIGHLTPSDVKVINDKIEACKIPTDNITAFTDSKIDEVSIAGEAYKISKGINIEGVARQKDVNKLAIKVEALSGTCLLYTSPSPRDRQKSRMPSSA